MAEKVHAHPIVAATSVAAHLQMSRIRPPPTSALQKDALINAKTATKAIQNSLNHAAVHGIDEAASPASLKWFKKTQSR
jgi:hypothetical protein